MPTKNTWWHAFRYVFHFRSPIRHRTQNAPLMDKRVVIHGTTHEDMNGKCGVATDFHPMGGLHDRSQDRYVVQLDSGEAFKVKPANVRAEGAGAGPPGRSLSWGHERAEAGAHPVLRVELGAGADGAASAQAAFAPSVIQELQRQHAQHVGDHPRARVPGVGTRSRSNARPRPLSPLHCPLLVCRGVDPVRLSEREKRNEIPESDRTGDAEVLLLGLFKEDADDEGFKATRWLPLGDAAPVLGAQPRGAAAAVELSPAQLRPLLHARAHACARRDGGSPGRGRSFSG